MFSRPLLPHLAQLSAARLLLLFGLLAIAPIQGRAQQPATPAVTTPAVTTPAAAAPAATVTLPPYLRQDLYPKWIDAKAQVTWPPNDGCAAPPAPQTIPAGTMIDRFGSENGRFFSPRGESYAGRAVPYVCSKMVYTVYRVVHPLKVMACKAAPWFDEPGGAMQYQTEDPAFKLREAGIIEVAANDNTGPGKPTSPCGSP